MFSCYIDDYLFALHLNSRAVLLPNFFFKFVSEAGVIILESSVYEVFFTLFHCQPGLHSSILQLNKQKAISIKNTILNQVSSYKLYTYIVLN